ncbi:FecR family protein [Erwinia sp. V71]|uniref:FecR family protein n=1 Tax=Erwinia sp. V71 TaxID=3369424 RepID=UPI003F6368CE
MNDKQKQANQDALDWLILLQEQPDDAALQARFEHWCSESQENQRAWSEARQTWQLLGAAGRSRATIPPLPVRRQLRWPYYSGALAAALFALALFSPPAMNYWRGADYSTGTAEVRTIHLDDGSSLFLAAGSAIKIDYQPSLRQVRLLQGEAYFEVQPDASRPFRVQAEQVTTTVLGTAFDVRMANNAVAVAVNHGRVQVSAPGIAPGVSAPLQKGDWLRVGVQGEALRGQQPPDSVGTWRRGMLLVKDRTVADVVEEIGRYYHGVIMVTDDALASRRVTGMYDLKQPRQALQAVALAHNARIHQISPWLTLISPR